LTAARAGTKTNFAAHALHGSNAVPMWELIFPLCLENWKRRREPIFLNPRHPRNGGRLRKI
jgi:hypothetical protein